MMRFVMNVIRVVQWIPVIWRDVDWDWSGLLDIIDYKVKRMRQLHLSGSTGAHWSQRVREMDELRHLIALVNDDPDEESMLHQSQWHTGSGLAEFNKPCKAGEIVWNAS